MEATIQQTNGCGTLREVLARLRQHMPELRDKFNVASLRVFGSYARGEQQGDSDLDMLVEYSRVPGLFEFCRLENTLSDLLGVKVDLMMEDAMRPRARATAVRDAVAV